MMDRKSALADGMLLLTAAIWGAGFSATQYAIDSGMPSSLILLMRFAVAALLLLAVCFPQVRALTRREALLGALSGLFLFLGFFFQTEGQARTTPSNCAFLTTTNVLMVPFLLWAVSGKRPEMKNLLLPVLTAAGVFVLGFTPGQGFSFSPGDGLSVACAFFFACHIASLGYTSPRVEARKLTFMQMVTAAALSLLYFLLTQRSAPTGEMLKRGALPVLYLGLFSTGICFFLQTAAQRHANAAKAAIFLSMEGVFGALFSVALGLEPLSWTLLLGGSLIFLSVALTEVSLPPRRTSSAKKE